MSTDTHQQQIKQELKSMDQRLYDLEEKMISIDGKLTQVVDAILGNPLTKTGGFVEEIKTLKSKIEVLETKVEKQEEFKKRLAWTAGIVVGALMLMEQLSRIYNTVVS